MRMGAAVLLLLVGTSLLPSARAEEDDIVSPRWPADVPLTTLLRRVSPLLDAPIVWNPDDRELTRAKVIGSIRLEFKGMERKDRVRVVRALLQFYEFDLRRCEPGERPVYVLVRATAPRGQWRADTLRIETGALRAASGQSGRLVAANLTLEVSPAAGAELAQAARGLLATHPRVHATYVPEGRSLMLRGDAPRVAAIARLLLAAGAAKPLGR